MAPENLPKLLTETYTKLVSLRIRLGQQTPDEAKTLTELTGWLKKTANTYEALTCILPPDHQQRLACAFVSATAYQLICRIRTTLGTTGSVQHLAPHAISPEIAALLLFHAAGAFPDALELVGQMKFPDNEDHQPASVLQTSLALLAQGDFSGILNLPENIVEGLNEGLSEDQATSVLWSRLYQGVRALASTALGIASNVTNQSSQETLREVQALSASRLDLNDFGLPSTHGESGENQHALSAPPAIYSVFGGPHHLATLLLAAHDTITHRAVIQVKPPPDVDEGQWASFLRKLARRRPMLWPNHIEAVGRGFLIPGVSATISFPTGAGKTTIIHLKIAATLIRGQSVVFLAPTHALVDQVWDELTATFDDASIYRSIRAEDLESDGEQQIRPFVSVMTPERCLALLGVAAAPLARVGLIVFDECHLLHPDQGVKNRRSLDAMLCLLNLTRVTPKSDIVLMSAMMANTAEIAAWLQSLIERTCLPLDLDWKPTRQARGCLVYSVSQAKDLTMKIRSARSQAKTKNPPESLKRSLSALPYGFFCLKQSWTEEPGDYVLQSLGPEVPLSAGVFSNDWHLTTNRNQVAAALASRLAATGIKTMVLAQNPGWVPSIAEAISAHLGKSGLPALTDDEKRLFDIAVAEAGGPEHVEGPVDSMAAIHHGLLMPFERRLSERLFSRKNGVKVLVVSPTLSMGVNLPAEAVIIAGVTVHRVGACDWR